VNLLLFQVQYDRRLWGPLGALAFYDTGQVAARAGASIFPACAIVTGSA
jgi:hypothetical protein